MQLISTRFHASRVEVLAALRHIEAHIVGDTTFEGDLMEEFQVTITKVVRK